MKCFRTGILLLFLSSFFFKCNFICAREPEDVNKMTIDEVVYLMTRTHPPKAFITDVVSKADKEPEFRNELVSALTKRLSEVTVRIQISNTVRSLRDLNAGETLMQLIKIWNESEKIVQSLEFADMRIQLLITIARFLPEGERVLFLIKTESDDTEAPIVRFRATILLCATGNQKAIDHVMAVYEKAKQEFPVTYYMTPNDQAGYTKRIDDTDTDGDMISSYIEKGMFLDPNNFDTDGDGLFDGNDRNPLCRQQEGKLSEDQEIAHFILYLHARYYNRSRSPFYFKLLIVQTTDNYDGTERKGLFNGMQLSGVDGYILHMNQEQIRNFRSIHSQGTSAIGIHKMSENKEQQNTKEFHLSVPGGQGEYRTYEITVKRFGNVWLPIFWELGLIT